jgi:NADP-dependent 3-hydroxy acid dehydrogenase YdfG
LILPLLTQKNQSGIGAELTRTLVKKGWKVAAFDIAAQVSLGQQLFEELGESFVFLQCDITSYSEQATALSNTVKKWGRIDVFCANAGIIDRSSIYMLKHRGESE